VNPLEAIVAAEGASRESDWAAAVTRWREVVEANPVNGAFWDRLGEALFESGDYAAALPAYERARRLGVWPVCGLEQVELRSIFSGELSYRIACCHARLGDREAALDALDRAVTVEHLRDLDRAGTDEHLASLRGDPRYVAILGRTAALSRVDGWRNDLRFLRTEIGRRIPMPHLVDPGLDEAVEELDGRIPALDDAEIAIGFWRLLRRLGDGHAYLDVGEARPDWRRCLPVWFYIFAEGVYIPAVDPRYESLRDAELMAVDGRPTGDLLSTLDGVIARDNEMGPLARAPIWLRQPVYLHALGLADSPDAVTLTVRLAGGATTEVKVTAEEGPARPRPWPQQCPYRGGKEYLRAVDTPYWYEFRPDDGLVYFQFNAIADRPEERLSAFYDRMFAEIEERTVDTLVIDLRWNGGGNTFLATPLVEHVIRCRRVNRRGGLFVIVGRATFSAAQNTTTMLDRWTHAVFVGEPSGSRPNFVGETIPFRLPYSGILANVSDLYWQTSWPFDRRTAIAPELFAPPTMAAHRDGLDPAMAAILSIQKN
jgi:tetratricopeptide (TPR) repeat protein